MRIFTSLLILSLLSLGGCRDENEAQSKDWYKQHESERKARVEQCNSDSRIRASFDCQNALEAESDIFVFGK
ncbi:EexN family lipoprotein [Pseudomonas sp. Marseille-Q5115]|uniref:EexN family lipoprotein n=1 Tax=Pseudomonas sp. Marseille-Q5115 TaxID=2866593 RepID=UPI001CE3D568